MRQTMCLAVGLMLLLGPTAWASDPVGVYAIVEKVEFEPNERNPERIKVWGRFVLAVGRRDYADGVRGYMYFSIPNEKKETTLKEWMDLKKVAGSQDYVAFGNRLQQSVKVRQSKPPAATADAATIRKWIADLDSDTPAARTKAEQELARLGDNAEKELRAALEDRPSIDQKSRIENLLSKLDGPPDVYPLGTGVYRDKANSGFHPPGGLSGVLTLLSPAPFGEASAGKVKLTVQSLTILEPSQLSLVFEIQDPAGTIEKSEPIPMGDRETVWTPKVQVKAGEKYIWRVRAVAKDWKGPVSAAEFKGK